MKILNDTFKDKNGKFSRKSLTTFVSFVMAILTGTFIVISDYFIPDNKSINQYAIMVFFGFIGKTGYDLYLTVKDKQKKFGNE